MPTKPCGVPLTTNHYGEPDHSGPLCTYLRKPTKTKCRWHWLLGQPIEAQVTAAQRRRTAALELGRAERPVVPKKDWPAGERWCSGCQGFVPLFYSTGSRCKACASQASYAGHVERTYGLSAEEYDQLLAWQGGRCFICQRVPRTRRLAVDHDHRTGAVRGLLCSDNEHGCNATLARLLNDVEVARRALAYVERSPLDRMRDGEAERRPEPVVNATVAQTAAMAPWNPFG